MYDSHFFFLDGQSVLSYKCNVFFFSKKVGLVNPDTLWTAFQEHQQPSSSIDVKLTMDTWTVQAGYPVVSVIVDKEKVLVAQERFLLRNLEETPTNVTWAVPLTWTMQSKSNFEDTAPKYWLSEEQGIIDLKIKPTEWVIFNLQSSGQ